MHQETVLSVPSETAALPTRSADRGRLWQIAGALLRLAKPGIVAAELTATLAGMLLATGSGLTGTVVLWTLATVALAASGAAMANGLIDAKGDRLMPRLAARCRAMNLAGEKRVYAVASALMGASLLLAALFLNLLTTLLLGVAMASYLVLYTAWQKRTSPLAILVGGIPGALPPLIGAASVGDISAAPLLLALVIYCWQLPHFLFLALQYQEQYRQARVPVFPLVYGERFTKRLILASSLLLLPLTVSFRLIGPMAANSVLILICAGLAFPACCLWALQQRSRYRHGFFASLIYLALLLSVLIMDTALRLPW